jgi:hypothetical protein
MARGGSLACAAKTEGGSDPPVFSAMGNSVA